jgi:hypothetical protein
MTMLRDELQFFIANQDDLVRQYRGKVLVIKEKKIIGVYSSPLEAYIEAQKQHELGTFLIQPCEPGSEAYTVTISSHEVLSI